MSPTSIGSGIAAVVAGPPLYAMVQTGALDTTGALLRGGVVLVCCVLGARMIGRIVDGYAEDTELAKIMALMMREDTVPGELAQPSGAEKRPPSGRP